MEIGDTFGNWTVIGPKICPADRGFVAHRLCRCSCGTERLVGEYRLLHGMTKSCGCTKQRPTTSRETKKKISDALKGRVFSEETRQRQMEAAKRRWETEHTKNAEEAQDDTQTSNT